MLSSDIVSLQRLGDIVVRVDLREPLDPEVVVSEHQRDLQRSIEEKLQSAGISAVSSFDDLKTSTNKPVFFFYISVEQNEMHPGLVVSVNALVSQVVKADHIVEPLRATTWQVWTSQVVTAQERRSLIQYLVDFYTDRFVADYKEAQNIKS